MPRAVRLRLGHCASLVGQRRLSAVLADSADHERHSTARGRHPTLHDRLLPRTRNDRSVQSNADHVEGRYLGDGLSTLQTHVQHHAIRRERSRHPERHICDTRGAVQCLQSRDESPGSVHVGHRAE